MLNRRPFHIVYFISTPADAGEACECDGALDQLGRVRFVVAFVGLELARSPHAQTCALLSISMWIM